MANTSDTADEGLPRKSRKPLYLGVIALLLGGGASFYVTYADILNLSESAFVQDNAPDTARMSVEFIALDPLIISLGANSNSRHLRFTAQLEVDPAHASEVALLRPRIVDVLNNFLRAVEPSTLEGPAALTRLRAQMLRRVQIVAGEGRVRDLLVMEFVLN